MKLKTSREIIIGFSLKNWPNNNDWPKSRKKGYLLNEKITEIISVDDAVLESVDLIDYNIPHQTYYYFRQELLEECIVHTNYLSLAVSMIVEPYEFLFSYSKSNSIYIPNILLTSNTEYNIEFLGYDVADFMFISSLTNCKFTIEAKNHLNSFKESLNLYGLFSDIVTAEKYKLASDLRVKEHAPFFVFGLYEIKLED